MACKYNPIVPTKDIPDPRKWCNVIWGYCQFQNDYMISLCPIKGEMLSWYNYWVRVQSDLNKTVLVKLDGEVHEYTISQIKAVLGETGELEQANLIYEGYDVENDDIQILKRAFQFGYATIYDATHLISLGVGAMKGQTDITNLSIPGCLFIGSKAFFGCDNLKTISFAEKPDDFIPVLDNIDAFYGSDGKLMTSVNIIVPSRLYSRWCEQPNWVILAKAGMIKTT